MKKLIVGNWKMYPTLSDSLVLSATLRRRLESLKSVRVVLAPPVAWLATVVESWGHPLANVDFAAQNVWPEDQGAYTGETSAYMVKNLVKYALVGHSERRRYQEEGDDLIKEKVQACLRWRLKPIICVGESRRILDSNGRVDSYQWQKITDSLMEALYGVKEEQLASVVIAYEPVWAVGSHHPAKPEYCAEIIRRLRQRLKEKYSAGAVEELPILYGGSVEAENAAAYFNQEEINGILVGGASIKSSEFLKICEIASKR
jgi:triosephosphate isomerase (TIM)